MGERSDTSPAIHGTGLEAPKSDTAENAPDNKLIQLPSDLTGVSADTTTLKRGRGRPSKSKSDSKPNGGFSGRPSRKPSGRPKRNRAPAAIPTAPVAAAAAKKSGRGRPKRSNPPPVTATLATSSVDGSRKRGRPKKDDVAAATAPASTVAPAKKRGRKPKTGEVAAKSVGRPKKETSVATEAEDSRELKKKAALLQKKMKEASNKLKIAVSAIEEVQVILAAGM